MWLDDRPFSPSIFSRGHSSHLASRRSRCAKFYHRYHPPQSRVSSLGAFNVHTRCRFVPRPCPRCTGDSGKGRQDLGSLSGVSYSTCFPPCRFFLFFISGFGSVVHLLPFSHLLLSYHHLNCFLHSSSLAFLCYFPSISSALPLCIYLSLYRTHTVVYQLRYKLVIVYTRL